MDAKAKMKARIAEVCEAQHEFAPAADGYYVYWPTRSAGYIRAEELRLMAELLDEKNAAWDEYVHKELIKE